MISHGYGFTKGWLGIFFVIFTWALHIFSWFNPLKIVENHDWLNQDFLRKKSFWPKIFLKLGFLWFFEDLCFYGRHKCNFSSCMKHEGEEMETSLGPRKWSAYNSLCRFHCKAMELSLSNAILSRWFTVRILFANE